MAKTKNLKRKAAEDAAQDHFITHVQGGPGEPHVSGGNISKSLSYNNKEYNKMIDFSSLLLFSF